MDRNRHMATRTATTTEPLPPAGQAALNRLEQALTPGGAR